jgi:hypothetical protein
MAVANRSCVRGSLRQGLPVGGAVLDWGSMTTDVADGPACAPNMSPGARAVRARIAWLSSIVALAAIAVTVALGSPWYVRWLSVLLPALVAASSYFEAKSNVCVLRAAQGTFEHDDRSRTPMASSLMPEIRRVATSVIAKGVATGLLVSIALTALSLAL